VWEGNGVPDVVVVDGPLFTVSVGMLITAENAPVTPPGTLANPGAAQQAGLEELRAALSARARRTFESGAVRAETPNFIGVQAGAATATVRVVTQGIATIDAETWSAGSNLLADQLEDPLCDYVRDLVGGANPPKVTVSSHDVEARAGAKNATEKETAGSGDALTPTQLRVARVISIVMLIPIGAFVLWVLDLDFDVPLV
jgi:hypothetical protein